MCGSARALHPCRSALPRGAAADCALQWRLPRTVLTPCAPPPPGLPYSQILRAVRRDAAIAATGLAALGIWLGLRLAKKLATGGAA